MFFFTEESKRSQIIDYYTKQREASLKIVLRLKCILRNHARLSDVTTGGAQN